MTYAPYYSSIYPFNMGVYSYTFLPLGSWLDDIPETVGVALDHPTVTARETEPEDVQIVATKAWMW